MCSGNVCICPKKKKKKRRRRKRKKINGACIEVFVKYENWGMWSMIIFIHKLFLIKMFFSKFTVYLYILHGWIWFFSLATNNYRVIWIIKYVFSCQINDSKTVRLEVELYNTVIIHYHGVFRLCSKGYSCNSILQCLKRRKADYLF